MILLRAAARRAPIGGSRLPVMVVVVIVLVPVVFVMIVPVVVLVAEVVGAATRGEGTGEA